MLDMIAGEQVYENMEARVQRGCLSLLLSTILLLLLFCLSVCVFETKIFTLNLRGAHSVTLASHWELLVSSHPLLRFTRTSPNTDFSVGSVYLNSSSHVFMPISLPTEPSPQIQG